MRSSKLFSIALLVACVAAVPAARANLIVNGSFELPPVPSSSLSCGIFFNTDCQGYYSHDQSGFPPGGPFDIAGWSVIGKGGADGAAVVLQLGNGYTEPDFGNDGTLHFNAQDGTQSLDLTGEGNQGLTNGVKQSVPSVPGLRYKISFYLGHQDDQAPGYDGSSLLDLYIDGVLIDTFANPNTTPENVDWKKFAFTFEAPTDFTTIAFINDTPLGNNYAGLDNVALSAIPEPGSLALLGVGFGAFILLRRRRSVYA
jgi:hypothetical protein